MTSAARAEAFLAPPTRKPVSSMARADAIAGAVAERHGVPVDCFTQQWGGRRVTDAKRELAVRLEYELHWTNTMIAAYLRCAKHAAQRLLKTGRPIFLGQKMHAQTQSFASAPTCPEALRAENIELRAQIARITGVHLAVRVTTAYDMRPACGLMLSVLAEAYPRPMHISAICEAYDAACDQLEFGFRQGVTYELLSTLVSLSRKHFQSIGMPDPIDTLPMHARRLSDPVAELFRDRFGVPRAANVVAMR